jgi:hypothetical protein
MFPVPLLCITYDGKTVTYTSRGVVYTMLIGRPDYHTTVGSWRMRTIILETTYIADLKKICATV